MTTDIHARFVAALRKWIRDNNSSQDELHRRLGINRSTLTKWFAKTRESSPRHRDAAIRLLRLSRLEIEGGKVIRVPRRAPRVSCEQLQVEFRRVTGDSLQAFNIAIAMAESLITEWRTYGMLVDVHILYTAQHILIDFPPGTLGFYRMEIMLGDNYIHYVLGTVSGNRAADRKLGGKICNLTARAIIDKVRIAKEARIRERSRAAAEDEKQMNYFGGQFNQPA